VALCHRPITFWHFNNQMTNPSDALFRYLASFTIEI